MALLVSAFPGCGKSTLTMNGSQYDLVHVEVEKTEEGIKINVPNVSLTEHHKYIFDSDSSLFPGEGFPENYVEHIKQVAQEFPNSLIMVSSHKEVRDALIENELPYLLVYPELAAKDAFINRYIERGSPDEFTEKIKQDWEEMIRLLMEYPGPHVQIDATQGIAEVLCDLGVIRKFEPLKSFASIFEGVFDNIFGANKQVLKTKEDNSMCDQLAHYDKEQLATELAVIEADQTKLAETIATVKEFGIGEEIQPEVKEEVVATVTALAEEYAVEPPVTVAGMEAFHGKLDTVIQQVKAKLEQTE